MTTAGVLGMTHTACAVCRQMVPAKVVTDGRDVFFHAFCPAHGESERFIRRDVARYLRTARYVKPAWVPREFAGDVRKPCPAGCGFCGRHEQHLCMPIIEITSRCNLACPVCLVDAGRPWAMSLEAFRHVLDSVLRAEGRVDVLNLSGGEPLLHPEFLAFVDEALGRREIVRVSVSTNGLAFLTQPGLLAVLRARNVVVSLQMDGFDDRAYVALRGRSLLADKRRVLDLLAEAGVTTSLTMTAAAGVNTDQFRPMLDYLFAHEHLVNLMVQPLAFAGRAAAPHTANKLAGERTPAEWRLTIPDVVDGLGAAGHPAVSPDDFVPLPCSHPLCFALAFYLILDGGGSVSINRLTDAATMLDLIANRTVFGLEPAEYERLRQLVYDLWSGPAASAPDGDAVCRTLSAILRQVSRGGFDPRRAFTTAERRIKSIFIHAFMDAETFDLARARRCCSAYPQPDGRLVPACVRNVLGVSAMIAFMRRHIQTVVNVVLVIALGRYAALEAWKAWQARAIDFVPVSFAIHNVVMLTFILIRRRHLAIDRRPWRQAVALVAFFSGIMFVTGRSPHAAMVTAAQVIIGVSWLLNTAALVSLGRSFGILIAVRAVKTGGLYSIVRHPMYLSDILFRVGFLLQNPLPWNAAIFILSTAVYVSRALLEEEFLSRYPEYRLYMTRVQYRFLPGIF